MLITVGRVSWCLRVVLVQCSAACAFVLERARMFTKREAATKPCVRLFASGVASVTCWAVHVAFLFRGCCPPHTLENGSSQRVLCIEGVAEGTYLTVQEALALIVGGGGGICTVRVGVGVETGILRLGACLCHGRLLIRNRGDGFRQIRQTAAVYSSPGSFRHDSKLQVSVSSRVRVYVWAVRDVKTRQQRMPFCLCAL
jgi:hypothetical protein